MKAKKILIALGCVLISLPQYISANDRNSGSQTKGASSESTLDKNQIEANNMNDRGIVQIKAKNFSQAEDTFRRAVLLDPYNLGAVFNLASTLLINKKEEEAIVLLNDYTKKAPHDGGLFMRLGDAYFGTRKVEEAMKAYEQAYQLEPNIIELASKLGTVYLLNNRFAEAEKYLEAALEHEPANLQLLTNLSSVYLANAKIEKAISTAKKALQVKASKEIYITLATAYEISKDYKNALIAFERARDLGDEREEVKKKIAGLKKVAS